jgi:hypothetical protein
MKHILKKKVLLLAVAIILAYLSSCICTKMYCVSFFDKVELEGFNSTETDSIIVETYEAKSNFTKRGG